MSKYDRMIENRKRVSALKTRRALAEIRKMESNNITVTVKELVERTGFSSSFFYNNKEVHDAVINAQCQQRYGRIQRPQKEILNEAMDQQVLILMRQIEKLKMENELLKRENREMRDLLMGQEGHFEQSL